MRTFIILSVTGEPGSRVFGSILDGVFEGKIISPTGSYYVEKSNKYFPSSANVSFHSVVYKESDVEDPYAHQRTGTYDFVKNKKCARTVQKLSSVRPFVTIVTKVKLSVTSLL